MDLSGISVLDISDPSNPVHVRKIDLTGNPKNVKIYQNYAYVTLGWNGFAFIDLDDPEQNFLPLYRRNALVTSDLDFGEDFFISGINAYGFAVYDVSDPTNPTGTSLHGIGGHVNDVLIQGDTLYCTMDTGMAMFDISNPDVPVQIGEYEGIGNVASLCVKDTILCLASRDYGLQIFDISDFSEITEVTTLYNIGYVVCAQIEGDYLYANSCSEGLSIIDISNPLQPMLVNRYNHPGDIKDFAKSGDYLFIPDRGNEVGVDESGFYGGGLRVVDVSDPFEPVEISFTDTPGTAMGLALDNNNYAYIGDREAGLVIYDITDPANPVHVGSMGMLNRASSVVIDDNIAYVWNRAIRSHNNGVYAIDITDPHNPFLISYLLTGSAVCEHMMINGDYLYAANVVGGLKVIDISDPANMLDTGFYGEYWTTSIDIYGNHLFAVTTGPGTEWENLVVYNIDDPGNPIYINERWNPGWSLDVQVEDGKAYIANCYAGVHVIDVSDVYHLEEIDFYDTRTRADGILIEGNLAYVGDFVALTILDITDVEVEEDFNISHLPAEFSIAKVYPNPFNPSTNIQLQIPTPTNLSLSVYNYLGREVAKLHSGFINQGYHSFLFSPSEISSGVYFIKASSPDYENTTKQVLYVK